MPASHPDPAPSATILVVDDDPQLRALLQEVLEMSGYGVLTAEHGGEGWRLLDIHRPHLVITDIVMPDHEGIEFISLMRQVTPRPKVIAISGGFSRSSTYLEMARYSGADSTLSKPFLPSVLLQEVGRLLAGDSNESPLTAHA